MIHSFTKETFTDHLGCADARLSTGNTRRSEICSQFSGWQKAGAEIKQIQLALIVPDWELQIRQQSLFGKKIYFCSD